MHTYTYLKDVKLLPYQCLHGGITRFQHSLNDDKNRIRTTES